MSDVEYNKARQHELEQQTAREFRLTVSVRAVLFDDLPLSATAAMTVFTSHNNHLYALIESTDQLRAGNIEKFVKDAGFLPSHFYAPQGHKSYFKQHAYNIFKSVYPGRTAWTDEEEAYYSLLTPYSPALVRLSGVRGVVRGYNRFAKTWEVVYEPSPVVQKAQQHSRKVAR